MAIEETAKSPDEYVPISGKNLVMTREQGEEFEKRRLEPPRQPTPSERELVQMFRQTVRR